MTARCWLLLLHQWSKWEDGYATASSVFAGLNGQVLVQSRRCSRCGKLQVKQVTL